MWRERFFVDLPELQIEKLLLRKVTLDDAEGLLVSASDPEVARYTTWEPYDSTEQARNFLRSVIGNYEQGEPPNWGVTLQENSRLIGMCGFMAGSWVPESALIEIGYAIAREYWGKCLVPEAVRAVIRFGFRELSLNCIEPRCVADNTASERVMQEVGMSREGTLRDHVFRKGRYWDYKVYSILRREYRSD